jgi:hypothetical protein
MFETPICTLWRQHLHILNAYVWDTTRPLEICTYWRQHLHIYWMHMFETPNLGKCVPIQDFAFAHTKCICLRHHDSGNMYPTCTYRMHMFETPWLKNMYPFKGACTYQMHMFETQICTHSRLHLHIPNVCVLKASDLTNMHAYTCTFSSNKLLLLMRKLNAIIYLNSFFSPHTRYLPCTRKPCSAVLSVV